MKSWLKYGLYFLGIYILVYLVTIILISPGQCPLMDSGSNTVICDVMLIPRLALAIPAAIIYANFRLEILNNSYLLQGVISAITYLLIGALIGWIVGKIKENK